MDVFWLIPFGLVVLIFFGAFCSVMRKRHSSHATPHVLVDNPSRPAIDESITSRDWSSKPSHSYMKWLAESREQNEAK
jgi:hypothetical protein